ncbi:hypothetical protein Y032_0025g1196 [Ancylostoma ceylanicum]|uniref:Uncharacterized protein n=1 Tax=Ancylostoma ceylanicum TaxID=53326 RepID=A0A016UUP2_9BILA|nr:hypothetical protein Y032_0025g1196 [Ancylostoma ceylanicum]
MKRCGVRDLLAALGVIRHALCESNKLPVHKLGRSIEKHGIASEYEELVAEKFRAARVDIPNDLQKIVRQLPESSDYAVRGLVEVVHQMSDVIVGMATVVDNLLVNQQSQTVALKTANNQMNTLASMKLPHGAFLGYANLCRDWVIENNPPFEFMNLKALMHKWTPSARCPKEDLVTQCTDFAR